MEIFTNIFFWLFTGGFLGGLLSLRLARTFRERAAFAELPDDQYKFELRTKIFYAFFTIFLLAGLSGLGISAYQFVINGGTISLPQLIAGAEGPPPVLEVIETATAVFTETPTSTEQPAAESVDEEGPLPTPTPSPTLAEGISGRRVIGNTNFQGVNVRERPTLGSGILAKLQNSTQVWLVDSPTQDADGYTWQQVQLQDGITGWVADIFLLEEPLPFDPMNP